MNLISITNCEDTDSKSLRFKLSLLSLSEVWIGNLFVTTFVFGGCWVVAFAKSQEGSNLSSSKEAPKAKARHTESVTRYFIFKSENVGKTLDCKAFYTFRSTCM